jgi:replicative DNA helicase
MPYSTEAEQSVLGCVLLENACLPEVIDILKPEFFYNERHRQIFAAMRKLFIANVPVDLVTVLNELVADRDFDEIDGKTYLFALAQRVPSISNVLAYARIVREKYELRSLINAAREIINEAQDESNDPRIIVDSAEQKIFEIANARTLQGLKRIDEVLIDTYEYLHAMSNPNQAKTRTASTGIGALDRVITGLNKTDLIILAARPGMGKTSFALNIAQHVGVKEKKKVAFFSLEMTREQLVSRLLSSEACIESQKMRTGNISPDEWTRIAQAADVFMQAPIYLDEAGQISVVEMKARLRRLKDVGLVVIDYLQLMSTGRNTNNRVQEISEITRNLKIMAKELDVPVLCLSQLSRGTEGAGRKNHRPGLADLRDSGSIEQDADIVLFLYRDDYYAAENEAPPEEGENRNQSYCIVAKNRHGGTEDVPLHWQGEFTRFTGAEVIHRER